MTSSPRPNLVPPRPGRSLSPFIRGCLSICRHDATARFGSVPASITGGITALSEASVCVLDKAERTRCAGDASSPLPVFGVFPCTAARRTPCKSVSLSPIGLL